MIAEQPIPELGRVTASAITEVLATQFKLLASGDSSNLSPPPVVRGHRLELEISPGAKTCWSDWTCEEHLLTVALQFRFKSR